ncbi:MAG TPA: DUF5691 domain-containing protein [Casimicrobium sp.]|nr:DUF5691 domain-containing protein [Casimicrobium sp.]
MSKAQPTWSDLIPAAMVGTDRVGPPINGWDGQVGQFVESAVQGAARAQQLLRAAAIVAASNLVGAKGSPWLGALPVVAGADERRTLTTPEIVSSARFALVEGPARLQAHFFAACRRAGTRIPEPLLPASLEAARRLVALRGLLSPVLGARGVWLAAQNPGWRYACGVSENEPNDAQWTDGSMEQRRAFIRAERLAAPASARDRLVEALPELSAAERADLVAQLVIKLGADDEVLLDALRSDRSRDVRSEALKLLLQLPDASFTQRATSRIEGLLSQERSLVRKRWHIEAPLVEDPSWSKDNIESGRPKNEALGERAWWLYQQVRLVPLSWWSMRTGMTASDLLAWAAKTDWAAALVRGWRDVLFAAPSVDWCQAFLVADPALTKGIDTDSLVALLPKALRDEHWRKQLAGSNTHQFSIIFAQALASCALDETMGEKLSNSMATALRDLATSRELHNDYSLRGQLAEIVCALDADSLPLLDPLPVLDNESSAYQSLRQNVTQLISARHAFQLI